MAACGHSYDKEVSRVRSPDGTLDAMFNLHDGGVGGATVPFTREVYIIRVQPPLQTNWKEWGRPVYEANGGEVDLKWADAETLLISLNSGVPVVAAPKTVEIFDGKQKRHIRVQLVSQFSPRETLTPPTAVPAAP